MGVGKGPTFLTHNKPIPFRRVLRVAVGLPAGLPQVLRHGRDVHPAWVNVVTAALATKVVRGSGDES
jgi:hypothetical protein